MVQMAKSYCIRVTATQTKILKLKAHNLNLCAHLQKKDNVNEFCQSCVHTIRKRRRI